MEPHPQIEPLLFLLGNWRGEGTGRYPTIQDFAYREEVVFAHVGKPFLAYQQRTWALDDGRPLHTEAGYLRRTADGVLEWVVAHPSGLAEIEIGSLDGTTLRFADSRVIATPSAKRVDALARDCTCGVTSCATSCTWQRSGSRSVSTFRRRCAGSLTER